MRNYKTTFTRDFATGYVKLVDHVTIQVSGEGLMKKSTDIEKMLLAALIEIKDRLYLKLGKQKKEYGITLTPVQAIALRVLYTKFVNDPSTYMGSKLMLISNEVDKLYTNVN